MNMLYSFIGKLGEAPDAQLKSKFSEMCSIFVTEDHNEQECISFLRNIRDCCIEYAGGSSFVIKIISIIINKEDEDETKAQKRRDMLKKWERGDIERWDLST